MFSRSFFCTLFAAVLLSNSVLAVPIGGNGELAIRHVDEKPSTSLLEIDADVYPEDNEYFEETGDLERRATRKPIARPVAKPIAKPVVKAKANAPIKVKAPVKATPTKAKAPVKPKAPVKAVPAKVKPPVKPPVKPKTPAKATPAKVTSKAPVKIAPAKATAKAPVKSKAPVKAAPVKAKAPVKATPAIPTKAKAPVKAAPAQAKGTPAKATVSAKATTASSKATAGTCPVTAKKPATKAAKVARAIRALLGFEDKHVHFPRAAQLKTGEKITINGFTATLGKQFSGSEAGSGDTATFAVTWRGGVAAIAKQQTTISTAKFLQEIKDTEAASNAQGNGLFIENGCFDNAQWMIVKKLSGQDLLTRLIATKPNKATCIANLKTAAETASAAQGNLAAKAGLIQADENQENFLFNSDFTHVDIIDFGLTQAVSKTASAQVAASQLRSMQAPEGPFDAGANSFILQILESNGACK